MTVEGVGGSGDGDDAAMVQPVVIGTHQHQVVQLGGAAVFPVPDVMGVQTAGGPAPGHRAGGVAMLEGAAKPAVDHPGGAPGADGLAVALEPDFAGGITGQVAAFGVGEQRTQMQRGDAICHVDMHHHGGVLPVRAAGHVGVPAGLHQPHERIESAGQRRPVRCAPLVVVVAFPLGDQRILMRLQGGIECRRLQLGQGDPRRWWIARRWFW